MSARGIVARRRAEREHLIEIARGFVRHLPPHLGVRAAVVIGSVARGEFNLWSDIDVLIVAENLPGDLLPRLEALGARPARVQPIPWTPAEWTRELERGNPMAREALDIGAWILGSVDTLNERVD